MLGLLKTFFQSPTLNYLLERFHLTGIVGGLSIHDTAVLLQREISTSEITERDVRVGFIYKPDERHCTGDVGDVWSSSRSS